MSGEAQIAGHLPVVTVQRLERVLGGDPVTEDQIIRQVLQGGGNMPAYGKALSPSETTALVRFLTTLRGNDLTPAIDASRHLAASTQPASK